MIYQAAENGLTDYQSMAYKRLQ